MASRVQQDTFMDDSDDACPLCVEEFDLSDKNFRPCPCGYQVCQFCFNNIKNNMNGLCPACRRPYDDKTIEWKIVSPEEFKADVALQARKKAAARQKEAEKRQVETLNKKHLAGLRVVQKNLVYVVGLNPKIREEDLLQTLRGEQYFGQYGRILKIVVSKAKEGTNGTQSIGVYVTFARKQDAASCIAAVDGSQNGDRVLRAQYGTTKYCSAFLRNEHCNNRNCMFLHETGEDNDSFSRQDLSSINAVSTQQPAPIASSSASPNQVPQPQPPPQQAPQSIAAGSQPMARHISKDEPMSRSDSGDGSALPSSAAWAKNPQIQQGRRSSETASRSTPSPGTAQAKLPAEPVESREELHTKAPVTEVPIQQSITDPDHRSPALSVVQSTKPEPHPQQTLMEECIKRVLDPNFKMAFNRAFFSQDEMREIDAYPPMFDPDGGLARYKWKKEQEEERLKREDEERNILRAISAAEEEDTLASGSLQLGGEPDTSGESADIALPSNNEQRHIIQPPAYQSSSGVLPFGGPSSITKTLSNLSINPRSLTPQQQQHLLLLKSNNQQSVPQDNFQQGYANTSSGHQHQPSNPFQTQNNQLGVLQGHARQASRYTFANDSTSASAAVKPATNAQLMAQQSAMMPPTQGKSFAAQPSQHPNLHGNHFYSSVQGPPPGLKSSGTPPISGGGMFGQGHGFASAMGGSIGLGGGSGVGKNSNDDLMRELLRGQSGAGNSGQGPDAGKREFIFPSLLHQPATSTPAPAPGLLSSLYGSQLAAYPGYHDHVPQKQKKKGKKHRHANTSSSGGGGIVDLADPSILQARMHHGGAGQGLFGAQGQEKENSTQLNEAISSVDNLVMEAASDAPQSTAVKGTQLEVSAEASPAVSIPAPPGLSRPQDFPPLVAPRPVPITPARLPGKAQSSSVASKTIPPIVPVLPKTPSRVASPMKEVKSDVPVTVDNKTSKAGPSVQEEASKVTSKKAVVDASGSPQGKGLLTSASFQGFALDKRAPSIRNGKHKAESEDPAKLVEKRQHPGKLDITAAQDASKKDLQSVAYHLDSTKPETPDRTDRPSVLGHSAISRPSTPSTAVSRTDSPAPRATQPRTIRVLPTPKLESPRILFPAVAAMASSPTVDKQPSRRGTPVSEMVSSEMVSDNVSITSTSMSRPNSPPPSKVGSAPVRQTTKSQQKKERQARAKLADKATKSEEAPVKEVEEEPVQAPIVGRKKKAKKAATEGTTTSTPSASRPPSPPAAENTAQEEVPAPAATFKEAPKEVKESKKGAKKEAMRAQKEKRQARESPTPPASTTSDQQQKSNLTAAAIIADLQKSGEILSSALDVFKGVAGFNQRFDITQAEIANFAQPPTLPSLTDAERQKLEQGEAICVPTPGSDRPTIILPDKQTVRGLTAEQADRYLTLRKQTMSSMGPSAFVSSASSSSSRQPHGPFSSSFPADALAQAQRSLDEASTELVNRFAGPVGAAQMGAAMSYWTNAGLPGVADAMREGRVASMDVEEAEQAMLVAKRETEALEKRLNGLMKRNRRLMFGSGLG